MTATSPARDVGYDLVKIIVQVGLTAFCGILVVVAGAFITVRLKRATDVADECLDHLATAVSKAHEALRKMSSDRRANAEADACAEARRLLGELVTKRFQNAPNYKRIVWLIGELTVALGPADPLGRTKMTKARAGELEAVKSRIDAASSLCRVAIVTAARRNWTYRVWGKHN